VTIIEEVDDLEDDLVISTYSTLALSEMGLCLGGDIETGDDDNEDNEDNEDAKDEG